MRNQLYIVPLSQDTNQSIYIINNESGRTRINVWRHYFIGLDGEVWRFMEGKNSTTWLLFQAKFKYEMLSFSVDLQKLHYLLHFTFNIGLINYLATYIYLMLLFGYLYFLGVKWLLTIVLGCDYLIQSCAI